MGCRCHERAEALGRAGQAVIRAELGTVRKEAGYIARTFVEDVRAGAVQREMATRLSRLRLSGRR